MGDPKLNPIYRRFRDEFAEKDRAAGSQVKNLTIDERCLLSMLNSSMGAKRITIGGEGYESYLSARAARALLSLIGRGLVQATTVNSAGRVEFECTSAATPLYGKTASLSFMEKHGRWPIAVKQGDLS